MALHLKWFTFNPFSENTYVLYSDNKECIIFDPGCSNADEESTIITFLNEKNLVPQRLLLTHAHIDHVMGVRFISRKFGLKPELHILDLPIYETAGSIAKMYGLPFQQGPAPDYFLEESNTIEIDGQQLSILFTPGHSPGSICYYSASNNFIISGDVLFNGSIGRTDLPGGDFNTLSNSIKSKLYVLPENTRVFAGHGESTTIGNEKLNNPFVRA
ncbi:MAG: MBL fold metallo-hydrolase [Bacteroidia bacterium]|nr:MBL fold metallo-hydrolase [Bacteroidia bacterium]MCZ2247595.1 MBL fold metallo-hydrolase [Bacteroidia bacterium]